MSTIIRATDRNSETQGVAFNFDDMTAEADRHLTKIRTEAARIVVKAQQEADSIRRRAEEEGHQSALLEIEKMVSQQLSTVLPSLKQAVQGIEDARHAWMSHWESGTISLAAAIAKRLIRRELSQQPEITLSLVREALELAAGSSQLRILLSPHDYAALGEQTRILAEELSAHTEVEVKADAEVTPGGCRVETRFGVIDQQFEAQLQRIEEELKQ
jgi:flagellar assembly protein FliH